MRPTAVCLLLGMLVACGSALPEPAALDTRNDACGTCRMTVSSARFAGQIVAPGGLPVFFDDIGCLARYLREHGTLPRGAVTFVADQQGFKSPDAQMEKATGVNPVAFMVAGARNQRYLQLWTGAA